MEYNDTELIQQILDGDNDAFSILVRKHQKRVHALAWHIVGDFHTAEELTQDAFLNAYKHLKKLTEPQRFGSWMYVITRRCCLAWLRKKRMRTKSLEHLEQSDNEQLEEAMYAKYVVEERERNTAEVQRDVVKKLLARLQESERTVVTLHYFGEMSCTEIGEFLGVSANTIKSRLRRAQERLKKDAPIIRETLANFKITPNLTENIMREVAKIKPGPPTGSKPFVPWLFATSTIVIVLLTLGFGNNKFLTSYQKPYTIDADSEIAIDLVEAPVMEDNVLKSDVRRQLGSANAHSEVPIPIQRPINTPSPTPEAHADGVVENYPQWHLPKEVKMRLGKGNIWAMQFSPDSTQLALSCPTGIWFYDVKSGKEITLFPTDRGTLAFSPDGRFIVKGGDNFEVWETTTGRNITPPNDITPRGGPFLSTQFLFASDGKTFVSIGKSGDTIIKLNVETGENTVTQLEERSNPSYLDTYAFSEEKFAIGSKDGGIGLWDTATGKKLTTLRKFGKEVRLQEHFVETNRALTLAFSPDGTQLATGNLDTTIQLWDTSTGEELIVFQKPIVGNLWSVSRENGKNIIKNPMKNENNSRPIALAFSPDGTQLACGNEDSTIKLWNTVTGELSATFTGHLSTVGPIGFSPDGKTLASASDDGTVRFWNVDMQKAIQTRIAGHIPVQTASFIDDSSTLVSVSYHGIINVWDLKKLAKRTFQTKVTLEEPLYWGMYRIHALSPDGTKLLNQGIQSDPSKPNYKDDILRLTDVNTGRELAAFPLTYTNVYSPDGKTLAGTTGNKISLLNINTGEKREIITSYHDEDSDENIPVVSTVVFSPDGEKIISSTYGGRVQLWDVETGVELSSFFREQPTIDGSNREQIQNFVFSSDSSLIAVGSNKRIRMIGRAKQKHVKEISFTKNIVCSTIIFSPDNTILIVGHNDGKIRLWDIGTGEKIYTLDGHIEWVEKLTFSPDNKTLISVGDGTVLFWDWEKILRSVQGDHQKHQPNKNVPTEENTTERVLKFIEHSSNPAKSYDRFLTKGEVYLANEWYEAAFEEFTKYLTVADYRKEIDPSVISSPNFQRELFEKIGEASKYIQDKDGFVELVNKLIEVIPENLNIQLYAHLVLAKFYHDHGMHEKVDQHIHKIDSITANLHTESLRQKLNIQLSLVNYYHDVLPEKKEAHFQKINEITADLDPNRPDDLKLQLETNFGLANYYHNHGMQEKAAEQIQKTGFITDDIWMVLGPFDNIGGIGFNTPYIHENSTEIDLITKYDGSDGSVKWKKLTYFKLDGYINLGEKNVDWQVTYAFATVTSPDEREVQFRFDSDDQGKLWLNGKEEFTHTKTYAARIDTFTIPVTLKQGKNSILVKVCNEEGASAFIFRITDKNGKAFNDLKFGQ